MLNILNKVRSYHNRVHHDINGLVQETRNSSALVMELHLFCTTPSTWHCMKHNDYNCYTEFRLWTQRRHQSWCLALTGKLWHVYYCVLLWAFQRTLTHVIWDNTPFPHMSELSAKLTGELWGIYCDYLTENQTTHISKPVFHDMVELSASPSFLRASVIYRLDQFYVPSSNGAPM